MVRFRTTCYRFPPEGAQNRAQRAESRREPGVKTTRRSRTTTHELATAYFRLLAPGVWSIRGAGAMYGGPNDIPMHPKLEAILGALEGDNVSISEELTGSPAHCLSYTFSAQFDDGGLSVTTGNYWFGERGGAITGVKALSRIIDLLEMRVSPQTARAWALQNHSSAKGRGKRVARVLAGGRKRTTRRKPKR